MTVEKGRGMHDVDLSRAVWRKSSRSDPNGGNCLEVATIGNIVAIRDSKDPDGPKLILTPEGWRELQTRVRAGRYDL